MNTINFKTTDDDGREVQIIYDLEKEVIYEYWDITTDEPAILTISKLGGLNSLTYDGQSAQDFVHQLRNHYEAW